MQSLYRTVFAVAASILIGIQAGAQVECPLGWATGPLRPDLRGTDLPILAILPYTPPGGPPQLIVGGMFTHIGNIPANHIASWDGSVWRPLGAGTDGPVIALTVFNNNLIVGGDFDQADNLGPNSRHVAAWNGTAWFNIGNGLGVPESPSTGTFASNFAEFNNQLIVGGRIPLDSNDFGYVFRLNGSTWENVSHPQGDEGPKILQVFDEDGPGPVIPLLYCDCHNEIPVSMQRWNGSVWDDFVPAPTFSRYSSTITNDGWVVVGNFNSIYLGDFNWDESVRGIAAWDGNSWSGFGTGIVADSQLGEKISAVRQYGNNLYIAGKFNNAGGLDVSNMARWDGANWFGTGIFFSGTGYGNIHELRVYNNELFAGGEFNLLEQVTTGLPVNNLAKFNGTTWSSVSVTTNIDALATLGTSRLVMGGTFNHIAPADPPNSQDAQYLMAWNGLETTEVGNGVNGPVHALESFTALGTNYLYVAGDFTYVGDATTGINANHIALFTEPGGIPSTWSALGDGFNNSVLALERMSSGAVFVGGQFTASGTGSPAFNRIAKWTGSWAAVQGGLNDTVRALRASSIGTFPNPTIPIVVVGGDFTTANGVAANRIAYWKDGATHADQGWVTMGAGFNNSVYAIEVHGGSIYAGGAFTASGATAINHVARWTGTTWENVGSGLNGNVYALKSYEGKLYAACEVTVGGGLTVSRWDGSLWTSVDGGVTNGPAKAILPFKTELIVGGGFEKSQGGDVVSPGLARFRYQGLPWIVRQPTAQSLPCRSTATFHVDLCSGYEGLLTFQWFKDGQPLAMGWTNTGSYVEVTPTGDTLTIQDISDADEGAHHVVYSNSCGSVASIPVTLDAIGTCLPCPWDIAPGLAGDGNVGVPDLLMIINNWGELLPVRADLNDDGTVGVPDLLLVINHWGPCP